MAEASAPINVPIPKSKEVITFNPDDLSDAAFRHLVELGAKVYLNSRMTKITKAELEGTAEKEGVEVDAVVKREALLRANENLEALLDPAFVGKSKGAKSAKVSGAVRTEAMRLAKNIVKDELKRARLKVSHYPASEITEAAKGLLEQDDSLIEMAKANLDARAKVAAGEGDKLSKLTATMKVSDILVAKANEKKSKGKGKTLSAKQAGLTTKSKKPSQQLNA